MKTYKEDFNEHLENIINCLEFYKKNEVVYFSHPKPSFMVTSKKVLNHIYNKKEYYNIEWLRLDENSKFTLEGHETWEFDFSKRTPFVS